MPLRAALALHRELQDLPAKLSRERSERRVREIIEDVNERIRQAYRTPLPGPPLAVAPVDVEETVADWRHERG